jgi:hypothetical protein
MRSCRAVEGAGRQRRPCVDRRLRPGIGSWLVAERPVAGLLLPPQGADMDEAAQQRTALRNLLPATRGEGKAARHPTCEGRSHNDRFNRGRGRPSVLLRDRRAQRVRPRAHVSRRLRKEAMMMVAARTTPPAICKLPAEEAMTRRDGGLPKTAPGPPGRADRTGLERRAARCRGDPARCLRLREHARRPRVGASMTTSPLTRRVREKLIPISNEIPRRFKERSELTMDEEVLTVQCECRQDPPTLLPSFSRSRSRKRRESRWSWSQRLRSRGGSS